MFFGEEITDDPSKHRPSLTPDVISNAKSYCNDCPVQQECLEFAIEFEEDSGIWGGMTPRERRKYVKKTRKM